MTKNIRGGFSLLEVLIVFTIIIVLMMVLIVFLNPIKQIQRVHDSQRKRDLSQTQRILEDYYNDNYHYPSGDQICNDSPNETNGVCSCHICGLSTQSELSNYIKQLYCDPESPSRDYLYQYDCTHDSPTLYRICASLTDSQQEGISYNYGVASNNTTSSDCLTYNDPLRGIPMEPTETPEPSNTPIPTATPTPIYCDPNWKWYKCYDGMICNQCGSISACKSYRCNSPLQLYHDFAGSSCENPCTIAE